MSDAKVFHEYTQSELDAQYDQATLIPDRAPYVEQWERLSAEAAKAFTIRRDIAYGDSARERLDYFEPREPGAPLAIFFHGGAWRSESKEHFGFPALALVPDGFAFASVDFDPVPDVSLQAQVEQACKAFEWLIANAEKLGYDSQRICVMGHSSGAHLAAMVITTDWRTRLGIERSPICSGLLASGVYDLEPVRLSARNSYLDLDKKGARALSPIARIPASHCPLVVAWGESELDEFRRQSREFAAAWRRAEGACNAFELPQTNHLDMSLEFCDPAGPLMRALLAINGPAENEEKPETVAATPASDAG